MIQANVAARFLFCFAQGGSMQESGIDRLDMPTGLQPFFEFCVMQECDAIRIRINDQRARSEMRVCLMT